MFDNITFWTTNKHKLSEASSILWTELKGYSKEDLETISEYYGWDIREIQSMDIMEVVKFKAKEAYLALKRPIMVEDTGLYIDALNSFPWPLVKYVIEWPWLEAIFKMMEWKEDRNAKTITWVAMFDWTDFVIWYWELEGMITEFPRWDKFWYSNWFQPKWSDKTFWEMEEEEKNTLSMRKLAFDDFKSNLRLYLESNNKIWL